VGNPAEETYRYPNKSFFSTSNSRTRTKFVNQLNRAQFYSMLPIPQPAFINSAYALITNLRVKNCPS
jgi:hypothetical protein